MFPKSETKQALKLPGFRRCGLDESTDPTTGRDDPQQAYDTAQCSLLFFPQVIQIQKIRRPWEDKRDFHRWKREGFSEHTFHGGQTLLPLIPRSRGLLGLLQDHR